MQLYLNGQWRRTTPPSIHLQVDQQIPQDDRVVLFLPLFQTPHQNGDPGLRSNAEDDFLSVDFPADLHEVGPEGRGELFLPKPDLLQQLIDGF